MEGSGTGGKPSTKHYNMKGAPPIVEGIPLNYNINNSTIINIITSTILKLLNGFLLDVSLARNFWGKIFSCLMVKKVGFPPVTYRGYSGY